MATFFLAAFLANAFFVIGRNVGTVLFLSALGSEHLTTVIFISGVFTIFTGQQFSARSRGRCPATVNGALLAVGAVLTAAFFFGALYVPMDGGSILQKIAVMVIYYAIYIVEDIFTMFVAMQCASVAQAAFSVSDAKRLFGLVQLGNSIAAMTIGISIGSIAQLVGTVQLLLVQSLVLVASYVLNLYVARLYLEQGAIGKKKKTRAGAGGAPGETEPWWKNLLVLAMGLWSFTVIFTKTMYEYEYNVLVAATMDAAEMVTLTGYLYAGAGLCSTVLNLFGTKLCLDLLGMGGAILATPAALLSVSLAILVVPSVKTTFAGRLVDLSLRWSLNNTVRTVLWIAVPASQAAAAKPWVEGTIKKMGQAFNALVISVALVISGGSLTSLSFLSMAFSALLLLCCVRVYQLYLQSMWLRIKRRELKHQALEQLPMDRNIKSVVLEKLLHGGTVAQLDILMQMGEGLSNQDWEGFFSRFYELPATVQLRVIELSRKQRFRISDEFLLHLLRDHTTEPAVLHVAILAVGDRQLSDALDLLLVHLGSTRTSVRAAAAVGILKIGWGVGLGTTSSAALLVLEKMLDFPLAGPLRHHQAAGAGAGGATSAVLSILAFRGRPHGAGDDPDAEELAGHVEAMTQEWEAALEAGDLGCGTVLAMQLSHLKAALKQKLREEADPSSPRGRPHACSNDVKRERSRAHSSGSRHEEAGRDHELASAMQAVQQLPEPHALIPRDMWVRLLQHESDKVRIAALSYVREEDAKHPEIVQNLVRCLQSSDTYSAAEGAIRKLNRPERVQQTVLAHLLYNCEQHKQMAAQLGRDLEDPGFVACSVNMMHLLKFLKRQCTWCTVADLPLLQVGEVCDTLLSVGAEIADADVLQELYQTTVDLKDQGFPVTRELGECRIHKVAEKMCKGLAVQQWVRQCCSRLTGAQLDALRRCLELPPTPGTAARDVGREAAGEEDFGDEDSITTVLKLALRYIDEHIYMDKLQLLQLSILVAPRMPASYRSTRVLAAWKLLREKDASSEAAVLELLETMLPLALKGVVLPLLDHSPLERKLAVGASLSRELELSTTLAARAAPPPWTDEWFRSSTSVLGTQLAMMLARVASSKALPLPPLSFTHHLLPKMLLLSHVSLYAGLLTIHLAEIAIIASVRHCCEGASLCEKGVTYVIAHGIFCAAASGHIYKRGDAVQELHAICKELPTTEVKCTSPGGGTVLCISRQRLFELMVRMMPKFAISLLKSLVQTLPAPGQTGATRVAGGKRGRPAATRFSTAELERLVNGGAEANTEAQGKATMLDSELDVDLQPCVSKEDLGHMPPPRSSSKDLALLARQVSDEENPGATGMEQENVGENSDLGICEDEVCEQGKVLEEGGEAGMLCAQQNSSGAQRESFSLLERLVLLQGVKMFRYVPLEYLPSLAKCCAAVFKEKNSTVCEEGQPTDATLYIVADGTLGLYKARQPMSPGPMSAELKEEGLGSMLRKLQASDTMGNTGLLCDTVWAYSARALEDTWLLCIDRRDLTDVLRGRRDLASAVIRGLYKTFTRRIQHLEEKNVFVRRDTVY